MQEPFAPRSLPASTLLRFHPTSAPAFAAADLPSSRAELSERAMSLCPVPPGASQNDFGASVLVSATMTRLTTGDLSVRSFEAYIRDFTFVWLIPLSSWASARRSPSAQPTFLSACRFLCRTDSFHSVSSAELCLAHQTFPQFDSAYYKLNACYIISSAREHTSFNAKKCALSGSQEFSAQNSQHRRRHPAPPLDLHQKRQPPMSNHARPRAKTSFPPLENSPQAILIPLLSAQNREFSSLSITIIPFMIRASRGDRPRRPAP